MKRIIKKMKKKRQGLKAQYAKQAIMVLTLALVVLILFPHKLHFYPNAFSGGDNAEIYYESLERDTIQKKFSIYAKSNRPGVSSYYMPVIYIVFGSMIDIFGNDSDPYYYLGIILHAINTVFVFLVIKNIIKNSIPAFLAALSFGVYNNTFINTDILCYSVSVGLLGFFYFISFYFFVRFVNESRRSFFFISLLAFGIGAITKEWVIHLILIFSAYYVIVKRPQKLAFMKADLMILPYILLAAPTVIIAYIRSANSAVVNHWGGFNFSIHMLYRLLDFLVFLISVVAISHGMNLAIAYCILLLLPFLAYYSTRDRLLLFMVAWVGLAFVSFIISNFRGIYSLGRYLYLPSAAWFGLLYYLAWNVKDNTKKCIALLLLISYTIIFNVLLILSI
jgi:hypothetical protein